LRKSWPGARREGLANDQGASGPASRGRPGEDQRAFWNGRRHDDMRNIRKEEEVK
jgi:hypothetical protein